MKSKFQLISILCIFVLLTACSSKQPQATNAPLNESIFNYGTTAYGPQMGNAGLNPHENYSGWSTIRYGVGETLFQFSETMELKPWLASSYEQIDEYTVLIHLRDAIYFSSGRKMDGFAVKECLEHLISVHDRAPLDLKIKEILATDTSITIISEDKVPTLLNFLSDPYGAIIDMDYGTNGVTEDRNVAGTGPYIAYEITDNHIFLKKNENYWAKEVKTDKVNVYTISDGDTLTLSLQSGQMDATQGLPYSSMDLFTNNEKYTISSTDTSRAFFVAMNFTKPALQDIRVRKAISMAIDKEGFTSVLLKNNGSVAQGAFPSNFTFGNEYVSAPSFDLQQAKELLSKAGWVDNNQDGIVEKDGEDLVIRWLTYPGRQELPLLAESVQHTLKEIGIKVDIESTANHLQVLSTNEWDIYASAFVTAPTGDPTYFFTTHALKNSPKNRGGYVNEQLDQLASELLEEFDPQKRSQLAIEMQQIILDDYAFIFASHLKMSFVMKDNIKGFIAHPSDYYEITADLEVLKE